MTAPAGKFKTFKAQIDKSTMTKLTEAFLLELASPAPVAVFKPTEAQKELRGFVPSTNFKPATAEFKPRNQPTALAVTSSAFTPSTAIQPLTFKQNTSFVPQSLHTQIYPPQTVPFKNEAPAFIPSQTAL